MDTRATATVRSPSRWLALTVLACVLAACSTTRAPRETPGRPEAGRPGYYKDDGPADAVPSDLDAVPDAVPKREPLHRFANRPYVVFGREYVPATSLRRYRERGVASWYGRKFHGQRTAIGETYDMFAMSAAHPTLPIPSYARVTSVATGKSVIVRVNDRGPFLQNRVIDLSYAAAHRLGIAQKGSGEVEVEAIVFDDVLTASAAPLPPVTSAPAAPQPPVTSAPAATIATAVPQVAVITSPPATPTGAPPAPVAVTSPTVAPDGASAPGAAPVIVASTQALPPLGTAPAGPAQETIPITASNGGYVVQLGAFASNANAHSFVGHLANQLPERRVEAQVRQVNGLFRVYVGPYASREEARRMADRLRAELGLPSTIAAH